MLINHNHKFLFVHIQKNAGTSITEHLNSLSGTKRICNTHSLIKQIDLSNYNDYFKFCFVRNPWDRLYSWWNMMLKKGIHNDFSKYLLTANNFSEYLDKTDIISETNRDEKISDNYLKSISFNQLDYISDENGNIKVDFIGRFENINNDYKEICDRLNIPFYLSHSNKFDHNEYKNYYNNLNKEKVLKLYKRDIDYFNYTF